MLAAGAGTRLAPLTRLRPKALCPVGNVPLVDSAIARVARVTPSIAVNAHHGREMLESHLAGRVHVSLEEERALGTAGALGHLRGWIDGRAVLVVNADTWHEADLTPFVRAWDGERVALLAASDDGSGFGPRTRVAACLLPWSEVRVLADEPAGLYERSWAPRAAAGDLVVVPFDGALFDCGTPARYLAANLAASGGASVVGPGAEVRGELDRGVVWPGALVRPEERLTCAIRAGERLTVLVR